MGAGRGEEGGTGLFATAKQLQGSATAATVSTVVCVKCSAGTAAAMCLMLLLVHLLGCTSSLLLRTDTMVLLQLTMVIRT